VEDLIPNIFRAARHFLVEPFMYSLPPSILWTPNPRRSPDMNGFVGLAYISGMVTQTNNKTGEKLRLPFVDSDMRFMQGVYKGQDGRIHQGAFALV
jgi:hypothetical protein